MSVHEGNSGPAGGAASTVAGFLSAFAIFAAIGGLVYYPGRVATAAVLVALISAGIGGFQRGLTAFAVAFAGLCWFAGMVIAIALERPVF
ncbi:MAG TPA: hypothetical protein VHQ96_09895 [Gaiellaceae bacterium]|nr:hypothetical protein [Gaiellaceae bacterium]